MKLNDNVLKCKIMIVIIKGVKQHYSIETLLKYLILNIDLIHILCAKKVPLN